MLPSTQTCIFCGGKPTTVEDIFPKWLHRYLGNPPAKTVAIHADTGARTDRRIPTLAYTQRAKITCQPCNNNFVSLFDTRASPLLKTMFDGSFTGTLDRKTRAMLARWAMKTALLLPYIEAKPTGKRIPVSVYHDFRAWGNPARGRTALLMGQYRPGAFLSGADWLVGGFGRRRRTGTVTRDPELQVFQWYGVSFFIKNLVWQVFGVVGSEFALRTPPEIQPFIVPLTGAGSVRWPPPQTFDDGGLIGFTKVFWRFPTVPD